MVSSLFKFKNINEQKYINILWRINQSILGNSDFENLANDVVRVIVDELDKLDWGYRICVLTLVDRKKKIIRRVSFSPTKEALQILKKAKVKFEEIEILLKTKENLLVKSVNEKRLHITDDLSDVFYPEKSRDTWRNLQKKVGIKTSVVVPLILNKKAIGAMIFSLSKKKNKIKDFEKNLLINFTDSVSLAIDKVNLYKKLKNVNKELKSLDKLKDEFLNVAAHELRAPLTAVKGYLSMILDGDAGKVNKKVEDFLNGALVGTEREIRLVNDMLDVSRIEERRLVYNRGEVELSSVLNFAYEEFKTQAKEKKLDFKIYIEKKINDLVYVDKDRIYEVVSNLISNAIKYTDKGLVKISLFNPDDKSVRFEVADTGYGITQKEQEKLFSKFYRCESSSGKILGTGLGLYIVRLLIEEFKGKLGVESKLGKGSTFWFELPVRK